MWTRDYRRTGRERFAIAQVLCRVNANWILANGTLEFGTRTGRRVNTALVNEQQTNGDEDVLEFLKMSPYVDESTLTSVIKLKQRDFKIISLNCQSLCKN